MEAVPLAGNRLLRATTEKQR